MALYTPCSHFSMLPYYSPPPPPLYSHIPSPPQNLYTPTFLPQPLPTCSHMGYYPSPYHHLHNTFVCIQQLHGVPAEAPPLSTSTVDIQELKSSSDQPPLPKPMSALTTISSPKWLRASKGPQVKDKRTPSGPASAHWYWRPKGLAGSAEHTGTNKPLSLPSSLNHSEDFSFKHVDGEADLRTTVMIKNIPNKFTKSKLIGLLDEHCKKENQTVVEYGEMVGDSSKISAFDFLYLPFDFSTGNNLGYTFVNFTSARAARKLHRELHNKRWDEFGSNKTCEVTYARIQGLIALLDHFKRSVFFCRCDEYLPVHFRPERDGFRETDQHYVGKRLFKTWGGP